MLAVDVETDLSVLEDSLDAVACESTAHKRMGPHEADWYVRVECGKVTALCNLRRVELAGFDDVWCIPGCKGTHAHENTVWTPVRLVL